jgi:hypothetical protein
MEGMREGGWEKISKRETENIFGIKNNKWGNALNNKINKNLFLLPSIFSELKTI